jgi:hypothetical protein
VSGEIGGVITLAGTDDGAYWFNSASLVVTGVDDQGVDNSGINLTFGTTSSGGNITLGANAVVTENGTDNGIGLGNNGTATLGGSGNAASGVSGEIGGVITLAGTDDGAYWFNSASLVVTGVDDQGVDNSGINLTYGTTSSGGNITLGASAVVTENGTGNSITLGNNGTVTIGGSGNNATVGNNSNVTISNNTVGGTVTETSSSVTISNNVSVEIGGTGNIINNGTANSVSLTPQNTLTIAAGTSLAATMSNTGTIDVVSGTLVFQRAVSNSATFQLGGTATLDFLNTVASGSGMQFIQQDGTLEVQGTGLFAAQVSGFVAGETIDAAAVLYGLGPTVQFAAGTLTVNDGTHATSFNMLGTYTANSFHLATDGHGGTAITYT